MKITAAVALFFAAAYVAPAFAQTNGVQADIPFAFSVSGSTLPAGTYVIRASDSGSHILSVRERSHGASIITLASPGDSTGVKNNVLVFHRYGDQYFLSEIRTQDSSMNYGFSTSKAEKKAQTLTEEAKLPTNAPVLVALR